MSDWKKVLYEYASAGNEARLDGRTERLADTVADESCARALLARQARLADIHRERAVRPVKCETRLQVRRIRQQAEEQIADLILRRTIHYEQGRNTYTEERINRETVTLTRAQGQWRISAIAEHDREGARLEEEAAIEPHADAPWSRSYDGPGQGRAAFPQPYLNAHLFGPVPGTYWRSLTYDRAKAVRYAEQWWNSGNPEFIEFDVDCTNYVSQCLYAGGAPMNYTGRRDSGWWYKGASGEQWSFSWSVAHSLYWYLVSSGSGLRAEAVSSPQQLVPGDVIVYDFNGNSNYQHSVIVTGKDAAGMPLVNAHTANSRMRYWDYKDSPAWSSSTRYRFLHIADTF